MDMLRCTEYPLRDENFISKEEKCPDPVNEFIPCFLSHDHKNIQIPSQQIL